MASASAARRAVVAASTAAACIAACGEVKLIESESESLNACTSSKDRSTGEVWEKRLSWSLVGLNEMRLAVGLPGAEDLRFQ